MCVEFTAVLFDMNRSRGAKTVKDEISGRVRGK